jgi:hypothetical protein
LGTATEDRLVGNETIPEGDAVYLAYLAANRDEEAFDDPFRFEVGRPDNKHTAFGYGLTSIICWIRCCFEGLWRATRIRWRRVSRMSTLTMLAVASGASCGFSSQVRPACRS